ncbi:alpha-protein kinase 3 isoform X2 [Lacerta agilis]|uniref:alpha-protein kinase 3 isoform X2 n=1 Tax=Lacerta agilis TaxID=80427 RepID=UPI00141976BE|nr:alpha-protein kinase 3 isoform X2 [Lacerta agilis]
MGSRRRPLGRSYSGNGPYAAYSPGQGSDGEDNGPLVEHRPERRSYFLSVRPENRSTFCAIIAQLTEETQPLFETTLKSHAVSEDADAKFTCIVTGYPQPEVTWYKDDEEMDRYCGLPKYEIFRHGNRHTLQLYKCREEDAAIYQASARNNKGIVSCSGVLEVGTMTEYRIHQRWFAKLKRNAEAKLREIEQSRKRGKENVELEQLRRVSPDRFQRKRRLTGEVGMRSGTSLWDKEEVAKVRIPDGKPRFGEDEKSKETLFPNNFITGHLEAEVTTNGDSALESGEENGDENANGFLTYVYETVEIIKAKPTAAKEFSAKKKKKEEITAALPNASQDVSREEDGTQQRSISSARKDATPNTLAYSTSPFATNGLVGTEPRGPSRQVAEKPIARPYSMPPKADVFFSLKDMYFDMGVKAEAEQKAPGAKEGEDDRNQPGVDASVLEEMLPATPTALKRPKPAEEGQKEPHEEQETEEKEAVETKEAKTMAATDAGGDVNANLSQYPNWTAQPVPEVQGSLRMENVADIPETDIQHPGQASETGLGVWAPLSKDMVADLRETDLLDSLCPEAEPSPQPQKTVGLDSSVRFQEAARDLKEASLGEQLPSQGPCEAPQTLKPALPTVFSLQTPDVGLGEETSQDARHFAIKEGAPGDPETKHAEEQDDPSQESQEPSMIVLSQDGSQRFSVTSQNPPVLSLGTTQPIGKEQRVLREDVKMRSPRFGSDRTQAKPESKDLAAPGSLVEESSLEPRTTVISERYAPQIDTVSKEKQEEAFEVQGDKRSRLNGDLGLEGKTPPTVTARPLFGPEVSVEAPVPHQSISEEPHPVPLAFQEAAPLSPDEEGSADKDQSVAHLLRDVKREIETWQPSELAASESEQRQAGNTEARVQEEPPTPLRREGNEKESFGLGRKMDIRTKERERKVSEAPAIQDSRQTETAMEEDPTADKAQNTNLVSSLKNYLLLLLKMTTEADKSKGSKKQDVKAAEEKTPPTAIPKHLPDMGIAGLTPRTSRKIFERVETNQLFQSAESLQLTPKTSRRITGMINQELLACKESLVAEPEAAPLPCVPSIVVGSVSSEPAGPPDTTPEVSGEAPSALPSATPQELASGARRKIFLTKAKQADEMEGAAPDGQPRAKRGSPTVSPQQGRKNAALLQSPAPASPPVEKRSPTTARKMATLEVPKIYEEIAEENKNVEETTAEVQAGESRKANDPFKAPQVIRKIRAEQFSDASGNLKLWCQFFNILGDSKLTWYKDEVPVTDAKRSSGDEGQAALAIVQVSLKDRGVYQCTIQNEYGTDSTDFLLSAEVLSGFISKEEIEVGEEIEMTPMVFAKGLADSGFWGDKLFGRIMMEDLEVGQGFLRKACRARAIYGLEPVFESGHTGIIKVRNLIAFGGRSENTLVERNYDITIQECKIQNSSREYCKIFAAEAKAIPAFGPVPEIIPLYLIYRPANNIPYATMEEDLPGQFKCYCGRRRDGSLAPASLSEVGQKCCAFQHWLYQWTNGNILVTDLEGVDWKVTNVRIATKTKGYQGLKESCSPSLIDHFEVSHQCNHFCHLLGLKSIEIPQPPPKGKGSRSPIMGRKTPSAQSSPQLQKKGLSSPQASRKGSVSPKSARKCPENAGELQSVARPKGGDSGKASWLQ